MKRKIFSKLLSAILLFCLLLSGCGASKRPFDGTPNPDTSGQPSGESPRPDASDQWPGMPTPIPSAMKSANDALDAKDENVIVLGVVTRNNDEIMKMIVRFQETQSQYKVKLVQYGYEDFVYSIMRGQGPDIFSLRDLPVDVLAGKGMVEDLTPYFASSGVVHKEDIIRSVWEACSIGGKMSCLIPSFNFEGIIVEKGHTQNGGWTVADYLALAEKYPEGKICRDIAEPSNLFLNDLMAVPELYIDWEAGTCSFDSDDFIRFLEELKKYSKKIYDISPSGTPAERLYKREYLTLRAQISPVFGMSEYYNVKAVLGDEFELAGYPGVDGEPFYRMIYSYSLAMNAFSAKKEGAWAFLEYLLSEPVQANYAKTEFPARQDVLNQAIQDAMDLPPEQYRSFYNQYTQEIEREHPPITEEDRQAILKMLENVKRPEVMASGDIAYIILEDLQLFFDGSKAAGETAALIQNRIQLYLDEMG